MKSAKLHSNIWLKRGASALGLLYAIFICILSYHAVFYEIIITQRIAFCLLLTVISIVAGAAMIYSRKQLMTKISGFIYVPRPASRCAFMLRLMGNDNSSGGLRNSYIFSPAALTKAAKNAAWNHISSDLYISSFGIFYIYKLLASPAIKETNRKRGNRLPANTATK